MWSNTGPSTPSFYKPFSDFGGYVSFAKQVPMGTTQGVTCMVRRDRFSSESLTRVVLNRALTVTRVGTLGIRGWDTREPPPP